MELAVLILGKEGSKMMASKVVWMIIRMLIIGSQKLMDQEVVLNFFDIYSYFIK